MDLEAFEQLLTPAGQDLLAQAMTAYDASEALAVATRLRARHPAALVTAALTQVELRQRGRAKFGAAADALYFTPDGLEQATHPVVAGHRASRVVAGLALPAARRSAASLVDLGCGIGSDLLAFARAGVGATGVERDRLTAAVARANLSSFDVEVTVGDAPEIDRAAYDVTFVDPARRGAAGRTFDPSSYAPSWSFVEEVLAAAAVVKVAPGIPHDLVPDGVEAEWVSLDGALKEAALWSFGEPRVSRRASVLTATGSSATLTDEDPAVDARVEAPGRYLYEPDDAVIRAHLVTTVAGLVDGWLLDEHLAYVSSDQRVVAPFATAYEVLEVLPFQEKRLRAALRARDVGPLTIKKRGVSVTPETLRARLGLTGSTPATIVLTRTPASAAALLVHPLPAEEPPSAPI